MNKANSIFWVSYAASAVFTLWIAATVQFISGIILSLFILLAGSAKLEQDFKNMTIEKTLDNIAENKLKRIHRKQTRTHKKVEELQGELSEKVESIENSLKKIERRKNTYNEIARKIGEIEGILSDMSV
ncbi:MAG: hypothetical protein GXO64_00060 [Candidatus Micrarchaeota archaeon]|nr:hypothetical protein [Candidatus Micrarchaeota archaeon]